MGNELRIGFSGEAGPRVLAALHLGALEGEAATVRGFVLGSEVRVPLAWPEAPAELTLRSLQGLPGTVYVRGYDDGNAFARDWDRLVRHQGVPQGPGIQALVVPGLGDVFRRVVQPGTPFLLVWGEGAFSGSLQSLGLVEHGPSSLRLVRVTVPPVGGGGGGQA